MRSAVVLLCLLSTGCAFRGPLERVTVDHNAMVANTANELVLVNILRAREREPLHFTSINKLFGDASISGTASSSLAVRGGTETETFNASRALTGVSNLAGTEVTTPNLSLTMGGKTSIDVGVFDSQEFYQGITSSLPAGTLAHYLHQGWSDELFTYLFVSQIDFVVSDKAAQDPALKDKYKPGKTLETLVNDPEDAKASEQFAAFVHCYHLTHYPKAGKDQRLVPLSALQDLSLADLALLDGDKFDVDDIDPQKPGERWIKRKGKGSDALGLRDVRFGSPDESQRCARQAGEQATRDLKAYAFVLDRRSAGTGEPLPLALDIDEHLGIVASGTYAVETAAGPDKVPVNLQIVLRSIDGVIYFLGEYLRARPEQRYTLLVDGNYVPIIAVQTDRPERTFTATRFRGQRYFVPAGPNGTIDAGSGRSSQVFALVEQLVNLQKTAKERPTTQTVRVVQ